MFLAGIIPGPNKPDVECIQQYFTPLIKGMLELWDPGVFYTQTHCHPKGRRVCAALVTLVCDLSAARKAAGFTSHAHNIFCSMCDCCKNREGYVRQPFHTWKRRTNDEAPNSQSRNKVRDKNGICWSEFSCLPYFNLTQFVVPDEWRMLGMTYLPVSLIRL
ncbi:hypothetical protein FA15DRAFT_603099 [Coprinopsis marcescibilis]|uniref:Uncharacterized protein n=1 Tax=Coprinopsis marcescibilis TaxID=230819 RepID=A0A5C3KFA4_COPMA|nr:hypothetical protein FA15DRAFT_603099 [Coprinopsis marcescibilis]